MPDHLTPQDLTRLIAEIEAAEAKATNSRKMSQGVCMRTTEEVEYHDLLCNSIRPLIEAVREGLEPIPMLLFCPRCQYQHVDAPEPEKGWTNPPHATHTCNHCGLNWRPSNTNTEGVEAIEQLEQKHGERILAAFPASHESSRLARSGARNADGRDVATSETVSQSSLSRGCDLVTGLSQINVDNAGPSPVPSAPAPAKVTTDEVAERLVDLEILFFMDAGVKRERLQDEYQRIRSFIIALASDAVLPDFEKGRR